MLLRTAELRRALRQHQVTALIAAIDSLTLLGHQPVAAADLLVIADRQAQSIGLNVVTVCIWSCCAYNSAKLLMMFIACLSLVVQMCSASATHSPSSRKYVGLMVIFSRERKSGVKREVQYTPVENEHMRLVQQHCAAI